jgi:hypothetical protein
VAFRIRSACDALASLLLVGAGLCSADTNPPKPPATAAASPAVKDSSASIPEEAPALLGMGAQPCKAFAEVAGETNQREIALSGAMFSWAQGWFSARNLIGHESAPRVVGGGFAAEKLKAMLADECREHPDEPLYLAVNDLYNALAKKGL